MVNVIELTGVVKHFGFATAPDGLDPGVARGEVHAFFLGLDPWRGVRATRAAPARGLELEPAAALPRRGGRRTQRGRLQGVADRDVPA
jgi:hypothetical protein